MTDATFVPRRSARVAKREAENPTPSKAAPPAKKAKSATDAISNNTAKPAAKSAVSSEVKTLEVGDALPNIVLKNQNDEDVNLFEVSKSNTVVIFGMYSSFDASHVTAMCSYCMRVHPANMYLISLSQGQHPRLHQGMLIVSILTTSYSQLTRFFFLFCSIASPRLQRQ